MGFYLDGYVLRPAKVATGNARSTGEATSGVDRDHCFPGDHGYQLNTNAPVGVCSDMYRAAVLDRPARTADEFCIWAATTGNLATGTGGAAFLIYGYDAVPVAGSLEVFGVSADYSDGTSTFIVQDIGGRNIGEVGEITIQNGETLTQHHFYLQTGGFEFDAPSALLVLEPSALLALNGGFSEDRGDSVVIVWYAVDAIRFWWSRNDADAIRFGWNGKTQRWAPFQGSPPRELGILEPDESFTLSPKPTRFEPDGSTYLPGDPSEPDGYALLRVGLEADSTAIPILTLVVSDSEAASEYTFTGTAPDAVVGSANGILQFNPNTGGILEAKTGLTIWYNPETFIPSADGDMGGLAEAATSTIVLSPIPGPTDRPFLRYGWRKHLAPTVCANDAALPTAVSLSAGSFAWSMTTGKVVLSQADVDRATPGASTANVPPDVADYELPYLAARIYYDGVSMTMEPVPTKEPVALEDSAGIPFNGDPETLPVFGDTYVPRAEALPFPGKSGILHVPDGTGTLPANSPDPETRPNGCGLTRAVEGIGDSFVFAVSTEEDGTYAFATTDVREYEDELNHNLRFKIPKTDAQIARMETTSGPSGSSMAAFRHRGITDSAAYFVQSQMMPCVYSAEPKMWSRLMEPFELTGADTIRFAVGGVSLVVWSSTPLGEGSFSAAEVAVSIQEAIDTMGASGEAGHFRGRIYISDTSGTSLEVGWNVDESDLTGHSVLGFLPGWRIDSDMNWLPDNGMSFGLFRSPENVNAKEFIADINAIGRMNEVLTDNIPGVPFVTLSVFPLEDLPGFDTDVHFRVAQGLNIVDLKNYDGLHYEFIDDRFAWTATQSLSPTSIVMPAVTLQMATPMVLPDTVSSAAMAPLGNGFGLYLREPQDTTTTELELNQDFLLPANGAAGQAALISLIGGLTAQGAAGYFEAGQTTFYDNNISDWEDTTSMPVTPESGYLLRILNGDAEGVYTITEVTPTHLVVEPPFPVGAGVTSSLPFAQWRMYEGFTRGVYDPALVADVQQELFNHFVTDPFVIRTMSYMNDVEAANNPVHAEASAALQRGRNMFVRFTPSDSLEYTAATDHTTITLLERGIEVGVLSAEGLTVPDITDLHFSESTLATGTAYFGFRVGAKSYTAAEGNLEIVSVFTATGDVIQVGAPATAIEGQIFIGATAATEGAAQLVYYDQYPLDPSKIDAGTSQMDPATGDITLSAEDITSHSGGRVYFVEQMITEDKLDVTSAPMTGAILFNDPLRAGQIVEVSYFQADSNGDKLTDEDTGEVLPENTEYLPLIVRLEEATRVDEVTYTFNPEGKTVSEDVEPFVWVGVELQNYAGTVTVDVGTSTNTLMFMAEVEETDTVKINYGVLEAFGGESAYSVSTPPVYRKPFFLEKAQDTFELETNRTGDLPIGAVILIGPAPFYIQETAYDSTTDVTTVTIWPPPATEVGSRSPGRDAVTSVSAVPVAIIIDPEGSALAADGAAGFLMEFSDAIFLPTDKGSLNISFYGDYREYTKSQHLLEIGGYPLIIVGATLSDDGRYTEVAVATPMPQGFSWDADPTRSDSIRISVRPIYLPDVASFRGLGPFLDGEEHEVFLLGSVDEAGQELPGTTLAPDIEFVADPSNGAITFVATAHRPLRGGERLLFRHTRMNSTMPIIVDNAQVNPVYSTKHISMETPSVDNGLRGSTLVAKYSYRNPDAFYCRTVPIELYLPDVASSALAKVSASSPSGGPILAFPGSPINHKEGTFGLRGAVHNLKDEDRGARNFLEVFNAIIVSFEQVLEAIDGRFIGDRDGKFRLFVGHGKRYAPPGYEDIYSGKLNQRNLWRLVVEEWANESALADGYVIEADGIYGPDTYVEDTHGGDTPGDVDGWTKSGAEIDLWIEFQRRRVKNDMDDRVLTDLKGGTFLAMLFPWLEVDGKYEDMWQPHQLSRLFPERTLAFTRLFPGLEANQEAEYAGFYSAGRKTELPGPEPGETTETVLSTKGTPIGNVMNPVFPGGVPNIVDISVRNRFPRARIWAYYPLGDAALDSALSISTIGKATFVVTPVPFAEFPIDQSTGFPDITQLISNGGGIADAGSGDFNLATPGFKTGNRLNFGHPDQTTENLFGPDAGWAARPLIFIEDVLAGCVITVNDGTGGGALSGANVYVSSGSSYTMMDAERGDTLYCGPPANASDIPDPETDEPTLEDLEIAAEALEDYRVQFDIAVNARRAKFVDNSLSQGWGNDELFPFNLQSLFGQNPPKPMSTLEADVDFINTGGQPVQVPALKGEAKNDSGDVSIPYMGTKNTELQILGDVAAAIRGFFEYDSTMIPPAWPSGALTGFMANEFQFWKAVFPDEMADGGTAIYPERDATSGNYNNPNILYTSSDMRPVTSTGDYTADSGEGGIRPFDLLFVEYGQGAITSGEFPEGTQGILTVGDVQLTPESDYPSGIEIPRFVTMTPRAILPWAFGDPVHNYTARNAFGNVGGDVINGPGVVITEALGPTPPNNWITKIDFSSVGGLCLDDGFAGGNGGLWNIIELLGNAIKIDFYSTDPGHIGNPQLATLVIGAPSIGAPVYARLGPGNPATEHDLDNTDTAGIEILVGADGGPMGNMIQLETDFAMGSVLMALGLVSGDYYDFTITVDTYLDQTTVDATQSGGTPLILGAGIGSATATVHRDRLTFAERLSFAEALPRGTYPANGDTTNHLGIEFNLWKCPANASGDPCDVNACAYETVSGGINGGTWVDPLYLTLKERIGPSPDGSILTGQLYTGTYIDATADGAGDEEGLIRMMSWEHENNGITFPSATDPAEGLLISAAASSGVMESDAVCVVSTIAFSPDHNDVTLVTDSGGGTTDIYSHRTWIQDGSVTHGAYTNVEPGDVVMIQGTGLETGGPKTGTSLVRHAVDTNAVSPTGTKLMETMTYVDAGETGVFDLKFPTVKSADLSSLTVILEGVAGCPFGRTSDCSFALTGNLYLLLESQYATYDSSLGAGNMYTLVTASVYVMNYTAVTFDPETGEATFEMNSGQAFDASGTILTDPDATWFAAATFGTAVSGMTQIPIRTDKITDGATGTSRGYPSNNLVGYWEEPGGQTIVAGFGVAIATHTGITDIAGDPDPVPAWVWDTVGVDGTLEYRDPYQSMPFGDQLYIVCATPQDSTEWYEERTTPIYALDDGDILAATGPGSPTTAQAQGVANWAKFAGPENVNNSDNFWNRMHFEATEIAAWVGTDMVNYLTCFLPGDRIVVGTDVDLGVAAAGHFALSGVFCEPSFPRSTTNFTDAIPKVVSQGHPLTTADLNLIGMRRNSDHVDPIIWYAEVSCNVRRIRRFHDVATDIVTDLTPLRYVYWTRKGYIDAGAVPAAGDLSFTADLATTGEATNLGNFDVADVNINAGDVVRLLDAEGDVLDTAEVRRVDGPAELKLRTPGFTETLVNTAVTFEIYLEQPIVPQQQSNDQLLELLTDEVIRKVQVSYAAGDEDGGHVEEANKFKDSTLVGNWDGTGVAKGDYIIIDPAGPLYIPAEEMGARAVGDRSAPDRADGSYLAGNPSMLDDNRGFYKVEEVEPIELTVSGTSIFCGSSDTGGDDIQFGAAAAEYVVLPTVHGSLAPSGSDEGQQQLRITTAAADDGSGEPFPGNMSFLARDQVSALDYNSIQPFGYRIIRPSPLFSQDATELILFMRGRLLSWMEEIEATFDKAGDYYVFQRDDHIDTLPSATDPTKGFGILTNAILRSVVGELDYAPFANNTDCVSILDRRFWILDYRLDSEFPPGGATAYTAFTTNAEQQRPVLVDHIDDALDLGDKFREQRFSWIAFRADKGDGSITTARREEDALPSKITKQQQLAEQRKALDES